MTFDEKYMISNHICDISMYWMKIERSTENGVVALRYIQTWAY